MRDDLAGLAINHGEGCAESLVPLDETIERHRERLDVERSSHRDCRVQVVDRMARVKTVMKPEPALLERYRTGHRLIAPRDGSGIVLEPRGRRFQRLPGAPDASRHTRHSGGLVEDRGQWKLDPEDLLHLPEQGDRAERIATEQKEIFVRVNGVSPEHRRPQCADRSLEGRPAPAAVFTNLPGAYELPVKAQELRHLGTLQLTACGPGKLADAEDFAGTLNVARRSRAMPSSPASSSSCEDLRTTAATTS